MRRENAYSPKLDSGPKNRKPPCKPQKHDTFVLDFMNDADVIKAAFERYHRTTILNEETDLNKLHDMKARLDGYQVYTWEQVEELVALHIGGSDRDKLDHP